MTFGQQLEHPVSFHGFSHAPDDKRSIFSSHAFIKAGVSITTFGDPFLCIPLRSYPRPLELGRARKDERPGPGVGYLI
ncbi:hypothetical protein QCA50_008213 [Cerrena zonata]|uniref:Uncharacterized protein n=1 Tax=Cerrena zonata TaxID=2478898 RepID=A0AAW0GI91_9APHY